MKILASSLRLLVRPGLALAATVFCLSACIATPAMEEPDPSVEEAAELSVQDPERLERKSTDAEFIAALQAEAEANINADWVRGISVDAVDMYFRWPGMDGLVDLYRATGERRYIDLAVAMASRYIDVGRDQNGDGYLDWFSSWVDRYSHGHVEFRAADGIARVAEVLDSDPGLAERFGSEKSEFVEYLEKDVWGKAKARGFGTQNMIDSKVTHFVGRSGVIAISLYKITGKREYLDWVERRGMELKRSLVLGKNGAYTFNCGLDGSACSKGLIVDTSHAGDTVNFIVAAYELGFVFDDVDIERLAGTVKRNLWNGSNTEPRFNDRIDGSDEFKNKGANQGGWIKLAAYDDELKALYKEWVTTLKPVPESDAFKSRQSVRVHILGNLAWACSQKGRELPAAMLPQAQFAGRSPVAGSLSGRDAVQSRRLGVGGPPHDGMPAVKYHPANKQRAMRTTKVCIDLAVRIRRIWLVWPRGTDAIDRNCRFQAADQADLHQKCTHSGH